MALKDTINQMGGLLAELSEDLPKAANGNRTAAQRVRTGSIRFARVAKLFRKESVAADKGGQLKRKGKAPARKKKAKKAARR